jgi:hypothetical protein
MKEKKYPNNINRGVQCYTYDEWGVPIPEYLEGYEEGTILPGPQSLELPGGEA